MKKKILASALAAVTLSLGIFAGCANSQTAVSTIEYARSEGLTDYYRIVYTDGSDSEFAVTNGRDGEDAAALTAEEVYGEYKKIYGEELTFKEFCEKYLTVAEQDLSALNNCLLSSFKVHTTFHEKYTPMFGPSYIYEALYGGSAEVYSMDEEYTYLVTNYHVIYDDGAAQGYDKYAEKIWVYAYGSEAEPAFDSDAREYRADDGYAVSCEYIGGSIDYDVAVIRARTADIKAVNPQIKPVTVSYEYSVGEVTYAIGNPDGEGISVTEGIVSVDSDNISLQIDGNTRYYRSIRTDTAITNGSSGGGLFNAAGELIGLNNAGDRSVSSMNYAIPAIRLTGVADGVIHYYTTKNEKCTYAADLGATTTSSESRFVYDETTGGGRIVEKTTVTEVEAGGLASAAGLLTDDEITAVTLRGVKTEITRGYELDDLLLTVRSGDGIIFHYVRSGESGQTAEHTVSKDELIKLS